MNEPEVVDEYAVYELKYTLLLVTMVHELQEIGCNISLLRSGKEIYEEWERLIGYEKA